MKRNPTETAAKLLKSIMLRFSTLEMTLKWALMSFCQKKIDATHLFIDDGYWAQIGKNSINHMSTLTNKSYHLFQLELLIVLVTFSNSHQMFCVYDIMVITTTITTTTSI